MILDVLHTTRYAYEQAPAYGLQQVRLIPKSGPTQTVMTWDVTFEGAEAQVSFEDHYANSVTTIRSLNNSEVIKIVSRGRIDVTMSNGIYGKHDQLMPLWYYTRRTRLTEPTANIITLSHALVDNNDPLAELHQLSANILAQVPYKIGGSHVLTSAGEALKAHSGVCQDHAHIFLSATRAAGFPARYVSGYLMMNDRVDQDAMHAWAEVYIEGLGWTGFDVSNGLSPDERYVRLATGLDYLDAAPVSGLTFGAIGEALDVEVQVQQ